MSVCQHYPVPFMFIQMFQKRLSFLTCAQNGLEGGSLEGEPRGPGGYVVQLGHE